MTGKGILEALSFVDARYIEEAEDGKLTASRSWVRLLPLAACLCAVLFVWYRIPQHTKPSEAAANEAIEETLADMVYGMLKIEQENLPEPGERVSILLRFDRWEGEHKFRATVVQLPETETFSPGTELTVILQTDPAWEEAKIEMDKDFSEISLNPGDLVYVELYHYVESAATIWVEDIRLYKEDAP